MMFFFPQMLSVITTSGPVNMLESVVSPLHAEDVSQSVNRQADPPRQPQLVLQETSHLLGAEDVAEHPDLRPLPLDVGVARRQSGAPDEPVQSSPHLFDVLRLPAVVLTDHPSDPLAEVETVDGNHVTEPFGQRLRALQRDAFLCRDAPGPFDRRVCDGDAVSVFVRRRSGDRLSVWSVKERSRRNVF